MKIIARPLPERREIAPEFLATVIDRLIQEHPPNFDETSEQDLIFAIQYRYTDLDPAPPTELLAALYLITSLSDKNTLVHHLKRIGSSVTADEEACTHYLNVAKSEGIQLNEEQAAAALIYAAISQTPSLSVSTLVNSLRKVVLPNFSWPRVITNFDQELLRVTPKQFLALYNGLRPLAQDGILDIQQMWGGKWHCRKHNSLSLRVSLSNPRATRRYFNPKSGSFVHFGRITGAEPAMYEWAARAIKHPLVSSIAMSAVFNVALQGQNSSESVEAKRLFQAVVVPNLDIFLVSAFGVPQTMARHCT